MLVSVKQLKRETNYSPGKENSSKKITADIVAAEGEVTKQERNIENRLNMIYAIGFEPAEFAFERAIGANDSLYSNFAELLTITKKKIGRIVIREDNKTKGYATGFMVSSCLMLTNWHVFKNPKMAEESEIHFFYEYDVQGHPLSPVIFRFNNTQFFNNERLDYCFVSLHPFDVTGKIPLNSIGYLYLDKFLGKIGDVNVERLNIIHHPQGDYKQISIRENLFVGIDSYKIYYETDTAQGSSGSPVFNDQWQVVGLHHKSVAKMTADGNNYIDKDGLIIPITDDKIDVTKIVWLKNEGIRISVLLKHLFENYPDNETVNTLLTPPQPDNFSLNLNSTLVSSKMDNHFITINIPTEILQNNQSIDIGFSDKKLQGPEIISTNKPINISDDLLMEVAKTDKENAIDFSSCKGYDPNFLGIKIPFQKPRKELINQLALLNDKTYELKYFKYSVLFNALRKMPALSAVNVEGDALKRLDNSTRNDDWLRDNRIDIECQLTDKFYSKSNFDKGHMSRFEDANWDDTEANAFRNGIYTCFYTNACPQVVALNRASGLWGKLEKAILEKGVKKEKGKLARISVFNGPIFNTANDRIFKGISIPMDFFKIIVWMDDFGKPKATAFKLSQKLLVDHIQFDESMRLIQEALDIDKDITFKNYQCSIKSLSKLTGINFKALEKYDTFKPVNGTEEILINNIEAVTL